MYSITEQLVKWLASMSYHASTHPPKDAPESPTEYVTVERVGGRVYDLVDHAEIAIQTWAASEARAEEMANAIREAALLGDAPYGVHSMRVSSGPYPFFDDSTRHPRYQLVLSITCWLTDTGPEVSPEPSEDDEQDEGEQDGDELITNN